MFSHTEGENVLCIIKYLNLVWIDLRMNAPNQSGQSRTIHSIVLENSLKHLSR